MDAHWENAPPEYQYVQMIEATCSANKVHHGRFLHVLMYTLDGNFQQTQKPSYFDPWDFPLWKGGAYWVHEDDHAYWSARRPKGKNKEVSLSTVNDQAELTVRRPRHVTSLVRWDTQGTVGGYPGWWESRVRDICSQSQTRTSICRAERSK